MHVQRHVGVEQQTTVLGAGVLQELQSLCGVCCAHADVRRLVEAKNAAAGSDGGPPLPLMMTTVPQTVAFAAPPRIVPREPPAGAAASSIIPAGAAAPSISDAVARRDIDGLVVATMAAKLAQPALKMRALRALAQSAAREAVLGAVHPCGVRHVTQYRGLVEEVLTAASGFVVSGASAVPEIPARTVGGGREAAIYLAHAALSGDVAYIKPVRAWPS